MKIFLNLISYLAGAIPPVFAMALIAVAFMGYSLVDYYVIDLTPTTGTYYMRQVQSMREDLTYIRSKCIMRSEEMVAMPFTSDDDPQPLPVTDLLLAPPPKRLDGIKEGD